MSPTEEGRDILFLVRILLAHSQLCSYYLSRLNWADAQAELIQEENLYGWNPFAHFLKHLRNMF